LKVLKLTVDRLKNMSYLTWWSTRGPNAKLLTKTTLQLQTSVRKVHTASNQQCTKLKVIHLTSLQFTIVEMLH